MLRTVRCLPGGSARRYLQTVQHTDYQLHAGEVPTNATIFSMIQPTGRFHLGNYLGATRVWKDLCDLKQDNQQLLFGVADLHAITIPKPDPIEFRKYRREAVASLLSVGIDSSKAIIFYQSQVPQHAELNWILATLTSMGYLNRMTQWKSKSNLKTTANVQDNLGELKLGLFAYPVLQAADILLYRATHVPVGDDQAQHLELTRTLATQFNKLYKTNYFHLPTTMLAPTKKILSLTKPDKKMSKSDANQNAVLYLNDDPETIRYKVKQALTDSISDSFYYDPVNRPGVSNLIDILSGIQRKPTVQVEKDISALTNYRDFKTHVADILIEELRAPRENFHHIMQDPAYIDKVIAQGTDKATAIAQANFNDIKSIMGFN